MTATEIHRIFLLRTFFSFLWINRFCSISSLISKFPEILILLCRKIVSVFIRFYTKLFPIAEVLLLYKNLIFFYEFNLLTSSLYYTKHFRSISTNVSAHIEKPTNASLIWKTFLQNIFQQCSCLQIFFKVGLLTNLQENVCVDFSFWWNYRPHGLQLY